MSSSDTNTGVTITPNGISIPDVSVIRQEVSKDFREVWGQDLDTASYTPQGQIIDTETAVIDDKNAQLQFVLNQFDPEKNEGIWQEGIGKIYFITRKPATPTTVVCQVVGIVGTAIPAGALVQDENNVLYKTTAPFIITSPSPMDLTFTCTQGGPIICAANTVNRIFSQIPGWDTVNNSDVGATGRYQETRIAFEIRRYDSVAKNAHGNVDAVRGAIADLDGVVSVKIAENKTNLDSDDPNFVAMYGTPWPGIVVHGHSMFISVVGGDDGEIAETIWERIDGGCGQDGNTTVIYKVPSESGQTILEEPVTFNRPGTVRCYVNVTIQKFSNTVGNIDAIIKQEIIDAWNGLGTVGHVNIGDTIYALQFACPISDNTQFGLISIELSRDGTTFGESITTTLNEFATIAADDITVIEQD